MRPDEANTRTFLFRDENHVARFYSRFFGNGVFGKYDAVPFFGIARNGYGHVLKRGVKRTFDGRVKVIEIAV